jgi:glycosyltransferase involved in cell wall biosynthesis
MVKAADAAVEAGFVVRFVSVDYLDWASRLDDDLVPRRAWTWTRVPLARASHPISSRWVSVRQKVARTTAVLATPAWTPLSAVTRAYARTHPELLAAILEEPFDFVYGGTVAALAATAEAAERAGRPFGLDFEDFHPAESEDDDADLTHALATRVIRHVIGRAVFTTAASAPMADAYRDEFGTRPIVLHNVVPRPTQMSPRPAANGALKLYWFSQVIGPKRGLEDVVRAVGAAAIPAEMHLRGVPRASYIESLRELAYQERARLEIVVHEPTAPDAMVERCAPFDIGLSPEQEGVRNRALCVPNKPLTYLAAGLATIATDTPGQRTLSHDAGEGIWFYRPGDIAGLAEGLERWHRDREALARAQRAAFRAAVQRFHWEHPLERGALIDAMNRVMS